MKLYFEVLKMHIKSILEYYRNIINDALED